MPFVENEGATLYWEAHGEGPPVLLIMGLTFTHQMWYRITPLLKQRSRIVMFDNRGVGRTGVPPGPYSIRLMSRDALAVLKAAGETSAHVIGASMGGMIAQELALQSPASVRSLLLASTSYAGILARWPRVPLRRRAELLEAYPKLRERMLADMLYARTTPRHRIEEDWAVQRECGGRTFQGGWYQFSGILPWSSYRRLPLIKVPTLVVHGDSDRLIPPGNGRTVAQRIPGARFVLLPDAGHILTTDQPEACETLLDEFLAGTMAESSAA
jgi:pimeloyl-ACP methyl ester carboxylesterase